MASARASGMGKLVQMVARVIAWTVSSVDDPLPANIVPMPGPAQGPVAAIDLRVTRRETQRRRKAS
jgi:hypothetical protein